MKPTPQKREGIRKACIEANPDIALRVLIIDKRKPKICILSQAAVDAGMTCGRHRENGLIVGESNDKKCYLVRWYKKDDTLMYKESYAKEYIQIIDEENNEAEIRLADVLLMIEANGLIRGLVGQKYEVKLKKGMSIGDAKCIANQDKKGWINEMNLSDPCKKIILFWNLRKDSLEDQSEETIDFLYKLLANQ